MIRRKAGLSLAEYTLIGLLRERPMHGYELAQRLAGDLTLVLPLEMSAMYAVLKQLDERGYIAGQQETVGARPPRTVYAPTAEAVALFSRWLTEPVSRLRQVRADFLVKLYFCRALDA